MAPPSVAEYYNRNTRRFLRLGQHQKTRNIHQPLWAPGVRTLDEAVNYANELVLRELRGLVKTGAQCQVLDLGCGVGSSVFHLANNYEGPSRFVGVSISKVQIELANQFRMREVGNKNCEFLCSDFLDLPTLPGIDLAFAIEAFLHASDASRFFASVASTLAPGGRLVLIDDFLTEEGARDRLSDTHKEWLADFRAGWLAGSLITQSDAEERAESAGLRLVESERLTPYMRLGRPRDKLIGLMRRVAAPAMRRSTYFRALNGGYAKQQCLKSGLVDYRRLVFEVKAHDGDSPRVG